ncbi:DNA-binding protein HU (plasmid) [Clostridium baratii str. Sullivan]|uniref:DNA-binding protein HU n=1 Tax=Clostridium baratii str. Sullivan TaxID=1415775 RepID=A0A0A7G2M4_9CLOT|nr:HU family DNA-binding protein [Clostridium baratii]AIY85280.1 DNA-binding protein HU [Clostridium baratii str. Sullivan]
MNKGQFVDFITENNKEITKKEAENIIKIFTDSIEKALEQGETVNLIGFGSFGVRERAAREGRNPRTKEVIKIEACNTPFFKPGKSFKEKVNK